MHVSVDSLNNGLGELVAGWRRSIRDCGFQAPFVNEEWAIRNATEEEVRVHREFQAAYWSAVVGHADKHQIVYSDDFIPNQPLLNDLKRDRAKKHGLIDKIFSSPKTRHFAELSPVLQILSKSDERMMSADVLASNSRFAEREAEKRKTLQVFASQISNVLSSGVPIRDIPRVVIEENVGDASRCSECNDGSLLSLELSQGGPPCARLILEFEFEEPTAGRIFSSFYFGGDGNWTLIDVPELVSASMYDRFSTAEELIVGSIYWAKVFCVVASDLCVFGRKVALV